ncbi:MAG: argininosuccinate synthase, partial [Chloroflexi bacterium]|nr:argininosuccinate synthase [Chloroflexota bacterium]
FAWTRPVDTTPAQPQVVEIEFERGVPVALDGQRLAGVDLIAALTRIAGEHGIGRIDHVEDRVVGIKSREVYEAPAAMVLLAAHAALESMVLAREQLALKQRLAQEYAELIYSGRWFSAHHQDIAAYIQSTQRFVSGLVRVRLHRGSFRVVGRRSPHSLYQPALATYGQGDTFDAAAAVGFIQIWGLPLRTQARQQLIGYIEEPLAIATPLVEEPPKLDSPLSPVGPHGERTQELEWIGQNYARLARLYGGRWIVVDGGEVRADGPTRDEARTAAQRLGIDDPYIIQMTSPLGDDIP